MHSHLADKLPNELHKKLDDLLREIELWHIRRHFASNSMEESGRAWFFNEFVTGISDCFYFIGWSRRRPVSETQLEDIWPI